jgi:hypothetical protein
MFITKKHIPRRAFLRGAGMTLALPLLDSMIPAQTPLAKTAAVPKTRFTGIFVPHGMAPGYWIPEKGVLDASSLPTIMEPLAPFLDRTTILSGLWSKSAEHGEAMRTFWSTGGHHPSSRERAGRVCLRTHFTHCRRSAPGNDLSRV